MKRSKWLPRALVAAASALFFAATEDVARAQPFAPASIDPSALAEKGIVAGSDYLPGRPSVVIVHGDEGTPGVYERLVEELEGDCNVFFYVYQKQMIGPKTGESFRPQLERFIDSQETVQEVSNQFDDAVRELVGQTKEKSVTIVAHSMGGLVARDAMTTDRFSANTLARAGKNALHIDLFTVATPFQGIGGVDTVIGRVGAEIGAALADIGSTYYEPMSDRDYAFLRGATGSNVTHHKVVTNEKDHEGDYVVTQAGQQLPEQAWEPPKSRIYPRDAGHNGVLTDPAQAAWLADKIRESLRSRQEPKAPPEPAPRKGRRVSMRYDLGIGGRFRFDSVGDLSLAYSEETSTISIGGEVVDTESHTYGSDEIDQLNRDLDKEWDLDVASLDVSLPLPRRARLVPSAELVLGRADVELVTRHVADPEQSSSFAASGLFGSAGLSALWLVGSGDEPGWHVGVAYAYEATAGMDTMRDPALMAEGGQVSETDTLRYHAHVFRGWAGYENDRLSVSAGFRSHQRRLRLEGDVGADFSESFGFSAVEAVTFRNDLEKGSLDALLALDVRIPRTPLLFHLDASVGGGTSSAAVGVTYHRREGGRSGRGAGVR